LVGPKAPSGKNTTVLALTPLPFVEYCDGGAGPLWPHPAVSSRVSPDQTAAAAERACA
jgi:hypothetical protein